MIFPGPVSESLGCSYMIEFNPICFNLQSCDNSSEKLLSPPWRSSDSRLSPKNLAKSSADKSAGLGEGEGGF